MSKQLTRVATVLTLLAFLVVASCSKQNGSPANNNIDYWTCTMHPSVHAKDPGKCPICSMTLVPVMKKDSGGATSPSASSSAPTAPVEKDKKADDMKGMGDMPGMSGGGKEMAQEKPGEFRVPVERQ